MAGKPGRSGAPRGNTNAMKNGTKPTTRRLVVGELPKPLMGVKREGRAYRRDLEAVVLAACGEITPTAAHLIDTASACTIHAGVCRWLLRNKLPKMTTGDILACSKEIVKAKQARDQAVKALELDAPPANPWEEVDAESGEVDDDKT